MGQTTIGWTATLLPPSQDHPDGHMIPGYTFNPWWGCQKVSPGCHKCYADTLSRRFGYKNIWGPAATTTRRFFGEKHWAEPLQWNARAKKLGHRLKVFCASMGDVFEEHPAVGSERRKLWRLIEETPWLNWLLLTKRPEHVRRMTPDSWAQAFPNNVWIGTSVENQEYLEQRVPFLVPIPAIVKFVSVEPLLDLIVFPAPLIAALDWVIVGGESGVQHRFLDPEWVRLIRGQCIQNRVPFFFKQWGGLTHESGGRILDGQTWDEFPRLRFGAEQKEQGIGTEEKKGLWI